MLSSRTLTVMWILLLLLGALYLLAPLADLRADAGVGLPADHAGTFAAVAGLSWDEARRAALGPARYITLLEVGYAVHELVFGLLFLAIVALPFRQRQRWAWWACWATMLANITYALTFGRHDATILYRSLIAVVALPCLGREVCPCGTTPLAHRCDGDHPGPGWRARYRQ